MIAASPRLFQYLTGRFLIHLAVFMFILIGIILVLDVVELLRRTADNSDVALNVVFSVALMKLPYMVERTIPIGILFSSIYTCWKMNKTSELVVMRSAGISAWQFLAPMLVCAGFLGIFSTAVVNPVAAVFFNKYEQMEKFYIEGDTNLATLSKTGIWLRQPTDQGYALINASKLEADEWRMKKVVALFFDKDDSFLQRIDCDQLKLEEGYWNFENPTINTNFGDHFQEESTKIPTELTYKKIEESFSSPETIPFWGVADYIRIMTETGLSTTAMKIHFHKLISQPFLFLGLILLSAVFSLRPLRSGNTVYMIVAGVSIGFCVFFMETFLGAFGMSHKIPAYLAAWSPSIISLMAGISLILHLEDG